MLLLFLTFEYFNIILIYIKIYLRDSLNIFSAPQDVTLDFQNYINYIMSFYFSDAYKVS